MSEASEPIRETGQDGADGAHAAETIETTERTVVAAPRHRVFLPQRRSERALGVLWRMVRLTLFRFSPPFLHRWRVALLRLFGAKIAWTAHIDPSAVVHFPWRLAIGPDSVIAHGVILDCMGTITVGQRTRVSQYSHLCAGTHEYTRPDMRIVPKPIVVGNEVWVAADCFIGPGVTVADRALVAARSSVFHDLPENRIAAGEPATIRRERPPIG